MVEFEEFRWNFSLSTNSEIGRSEMQELYAVNETKQLRTRFCNHVLNDSFRAVFISKTKHRRPDI